MPDGGEALFRHAAQNQKRHPKRPHDGRGLHGADAGGESQNRPEGGIAGGRSQRVSLSGQVRDAEGCDALGELYARAASTIMNLATNAIKGLSIPSRPLAKVRFDRDDKIIFWYFYDKDKK